MKKIILITLFVLSSFSYGQNVYNFSAFQQEYNNLIAPTSINNGQVWDYDEFGPFNLPFAFSINGNAINRFAFEDDYFLLLTPNADVDEESGVYQLSTSAAFLQDRTYSTGTSTSPIGYSVEGTVGNRILKLELRNAGFETAEDFGLAENYFFVNQQIWLYESDNAIEFRYGSNNITSTEYMPDNEVLVGIGTQLNAYILSGSAASPSYGEYTPDDGDQFPSLDAYPVAGTVYRFGPGELVNVKTLDKTSFALYPNPADNRLFISSKADNAQAYEIYNILGAKVLDVKAAIGTTSVNVGNLQSGVYIVKSGSTTQKFIRK